MTLELIKKTKNILLEILDTKSVTYKIYAKLAIWNLNLKFQPKTIQDLRKLLALESHQNIAPNNCDKVFKYLVKLPSLLAPGCTLFFCLIYHFFFLFCLLIWFFFSCFSNTSICINPEFYNFSSTDFNFISKISQHRIENRVIQILELKNSLKKLQKHNGIDVYEFVCI